MTLESELAALHKPLLRFAQLQLRNESLAEDVDSETLLAHCGVMICRARMALRECLDSRWFQGQRATR